MCSVWKIPAVECHWHQVTWSQYHKPLNKHTQKLSRKITKNAKLNSPTLTYRFQKHRDVHVDTFSNTTSTKCSEIQYYILGLYPGVASSLVSRGFLGTLPGDSSWKTEEGSTEHFPRWLVFSGGRWTVTGQYLCPA